MKTRRRQPGQRANLRPTARRHERSERTWRSSTSTKHSRPPRAQPPGDVTSTFSPLVRTDAGLYFLVLNEPRGRKLKWKLWPTETQMASSLPPPGQTNVEGEGLMGCSAAGHRGAIHIFHRTLVCELT